MQAHKWLDTPFKHYLEDAIERRERGLNRDAVTQRHKGEDQAILADRSALYAKARAMNPNRWSKEARNWDHVGDVKLNPERKKEAA